MGHQRPFTHPIYTLPPAKRPFSPHNPHLSYLPELKTAVLMQNGRFSCYQVKCPCRDSNTGFRLRRPTLYPLSYRGQKRIDFAIERGESQTTRLLLFRLYGNLSHFLLGGNTAV